MQQRTLFALSAASLVALSFACAKSKALTPTAPTVTTTTPADGSTLKITAPTPTSPINNVRIETFTTPTLTAGAASPTEGGSITPQYQFELQNGAGAVVQQATVSGTSWKPTIDMDFDQTYRWRVRAVSGSDTGPWSSLASFLSPNGGFIRGKEVFDPLTNGRSVGVVHGGHFVTGPNGGWESDGLDHGIDYNITTCDSCRVEFDVTNFGAGEGSSILKDVKWLSMGDGGAFDGGFGPFRDHPWKMHLEQRSDGDGTGMQVIWRNGAADADTGGDPEYGDHRNKLPDNGPDWGHSFDNKVWHFVVEWTPTRFTISIGENGRAPRQWFSGFFGGGHSYSPPNHRIQIGCIPRGESMVGARYRNFRVTPL